MAREQDNTAETMAPAPALGKVAFETAGEVARGLDLSEEAVALLGDGCSAPGAYLARLMEAGHLSEAIAFLAQALPKREGAWWAAQCVRTLDLGDETALARRVVRAAESWVVKPEEKARYAAMDLAEALGFDHPASWAAMAAFWSGDSLLPPDMTPVRPEPFLSCRGVNAAVLMTAAEGPGQDMARRQRALLDKGIDIANGGTGREGAGSGEVGAAPAADRDGTLPGGVAQRD